MDEDILSIKPARTKRRIGMAGVLTPDYNMLYVISTDKGHAMQPGGMIDGIKCDLTAWAMSMASRNVDRCMGYSAGRRGRRLAASSTGYRLPEACGTSVSVAPKTLNQ
jgi:hypothetical protein